MIKQITSAQNSIIKDLISAKTKKGAQQLGACFVESEKVVKDCLRLNLNVLTIFIDETKQQKFADFLSYNNVILISNQIAKLLSETVTTSGIFALVKIPEQQVFNFNSKFLVLDNLQDPSNLGSIIRSAVAFGYNQIINIGGVFPYLSKVIRSSMGYVFNINFLNVSLEEFLQLKQSNKFDLVSANLNGTSLSQFKPPKTFGLVIGNEGNGVSKQIQNICNHTVTIPMKNNVESLNASISASILMYNLNKEE